MRDLIFLLPPSSAALLIACAGLAFILQARRFGGLLLLGGVAVIVLPVVRAVVAPFIPGWLGILLAIIFVYGLVRMALIACFGREVANHALGEVLATFILAIIAAPFRLLGAAFRGRRLD